MFIILVFWLWRLDVHYAVWWLKLLYSFLHYRIYFESLPRSINGTEWNEPILCFFHSFIFFFLFFLFYQIQVTTHFKRYNNMKQSRRQKKMKTCTLFLSLSVSVALSLTRWWTKRAHSLRMQAHFKYLKLYLL